MKKLTLLFQGQLALYLDEYTLAVAVDTTCNM
jgi:hypothetical protein